MTSTTCWTIRIAAAVILLAALVAVKSKPGKYGGRCVWAAYLAGVLTAISILM